MHIERRRKPNLFRFSKFDLQFLRSIRRSVMTFLKMSVLFHCENKSIAKILHLPLPRYQMLFLKPPSFDNISCTKMMFRNFRRTPFS